MTSDPRLEALASRLARLESAACWLVRLATTAAIVGGSGGTLLWWVTASDRVDEWWRGTAGSVLVLGLCLAPALWLLNVRSALLDLIDLPDKLRGVASRGRARFRGASQLGRPERGRLQAARSLRAILRDYDDVVGSWGTVAQLLVPYFWFLTVVALAAVPVLVVLAVVVSLVSL